MEGPAALHALHVRARTESTDWRRMNYCQAARQHLMSFFDGHTSVEQRWGRGPMANDSDFCVLCFESGPKTALWTYCSVGASLPFAADKQIEFFLLSPAADDRAVELLAMIAHYHRSERLDLFHVLPIGQPWLPGSTCDCFFVSLPYTFGPELELMSISDFQARFLWMLPITSAERAFARQNGAEALEKRFDEAKLEFWNLTRESVA